MPRCGDAERVGTNDISDAKSWRSAYTWPRRRDNYSGRRCRRADWDISLNDGAPIGIRKASAAARGVQAIRQCRRHRMCKRQQQQRRRQNYGRSSHLSGDLVSQRRGGAASVWTLIRRPHASQPAGTAFASVRHVQHSVRPSSHLPATASILRGQCC